MAKTFRVDLGYLDVLEDGMQANIRRLDTMRSRLRAAVSPALGHPQVPLRASIQATYSACATQLGARMEAHGTVIAELRKFRKRVQSVEAMKVRIKGDLLAAMYMDGLDAETAEEFADAVDALTDEEATVINDLLDAGLTQGQLAEVLKGGHVVIPGGDLYDKWKGLGAHARPSSHYPTSDKDRYPDMGISGGELTKEILFGQVEGYTWIQLENASLGGFTSKVEHGRDWIRYAVIHGGKLNIGPWGDSVHTENHRPIHLGGACTYPEVIPKSRADLILKPLATAGKDVADGVGDKAGDLVDTGRDWINTKGEEILGIPNPIDLVKPLRRIAIEAHRAYTFPGFVAAVNSWKAYTVPTVVYVTTRMPDGSVGPGRALIYPNPGAGPLTFLNKLTLVAAPVTVPLAIKTLIDPGGGSGWDRLMERVGAVGGLAGTTSGVAQVAVGRVGGSAAVAASGASAVAAPVAVAATGLWAGWEIGSWYMDNTTEADRDHWWSVLHWTEVGAENAGEWWYGGDHWWN